VIMVTASAAAEEEASVTGATAASRRGPGSREGQPH